VSDQNARPAGDFPPGTRVADFRLEEPVGRGGMAVVYRAWDLQLDRQVALKILDPALAGDAGFQERFLREQRAAAAVDHPNIIPVFAAGEADGVLFIAMRYVAGADVRTLVDTGGPLPAWRAAGILAQVASALDAAHARGLVHRDVKPANMLLDAGRPGERADHVYLSDFGLSKPALAALGLTQAGQLVGTLDYVAPEQIENRPVDGRADLYALACAGYEMLAGAPPFRRDQRFALLWAQLSEPVPPLTAIRADLPPAVDGVMARALAKWPADRYQRCGDFVAALREACQGAPGHAGPSAAVTPAAAAEGALTQPADDGLPVPWTVTEPGTDRAATATEPGTATAPGPAAEGALAGGQDFPGASAPGTATGPGGWIKPPSFPGQPGAVPAEATGPLPVAAPGGAESPPGGRAPAARASRTSWNSRMMVALAALLILGVAGTAVAITRGTHRAVAAMPGCVTATATASAPRLGAVHPRFVTLAGMPFAVAVTGNGRWSFVSTGDGHSIDVLRSGGGGAPPVPVRSIGLPAAAQGEAITPGGRYLLAATGSGAAVVSVARAEQGRPGAVLGSLTSPGGAGAVEVTLSRNGAFAFVTLQRTGTMAVFDLRAALGSGLREPGYLGSVRLGVNPIGMTVSRDGRWLYVTSQRRDARAEQGSLTVVDVRRAEADPAASVRAVVAAGCDPGRVITTSLGALVWVTARASNALLAFSAARLRTHPGSALIASVRVGQAPVGLTALNGGRRILVANSGAHPLRDTPASLGVVDAEAALQGRPALLGLIPAGSRPVEFALEPGGRMALVTNSASHQLEAVNLASLG